MNKSKSSVPAHALHAGSPKIAEFPAKLLKLHFRKIEKDGARRIKTLIGILFSIPMTAMQAQGATLSSPEPENQRADRQSDASETNQPDRR